MISASPIMQQPPPPACRWRAALPLALLAVCLLFHFINNYFWLQRSTLIEGVDVQNHLFFQLEFFQGLQGIWQSSDLGLGAKLWQSVIALGEPVKHSTLYWPNLVYLTTYLHNLAFEQSLFVTKMSTFMYLALTLIVTYLIGVRISGRRAALLAVFLLGMFPMIFQSSRQYALDLPLTAMVALSLLLLIRSDGFRSRGWALLFGAAFGLGMLVKGQIAIYLFAPLIYTLVRIAAEEHQERHTLLGKLWSVLRSRRLLNTMLSMAVAVPLASIWWASKIPEVLRSLGEHAGGQHKFVETGYFSLESTPYSFEGITWQLRELVTGSIGEPFALLLAICLVLYFRRKRAYRAELALWLAVPLVLFSIFLMAKHARFLMPLLPAMALVMATVIASAARRAAGQIALITLICYSLVQFFYLSYYATVVTIEGGGTVTHFVGGARYAFAPSMSTFELGKVARQMVRKNRCRERISVGFVNNSGFPGSFEQLYLLMLENHKIAAQVLEEMSQTFFRDLSGMDYLVVLRKKNSPVVWPGGEAFLREFIHQHKIKYHVNYKDSAQFHDGLSLLARAKDDYRLSGIVPVHDSAWYVYANRTPGVLLREDFERREGRVQYEQPWGLTRDGDRGVLDCPGQKMEGQENDWLSTEDDSWSNYTVSLDYKIISFSEGVGFRLHLYRTPMREYLVQIGGDEILLRKVHGQKILWEVRGPYQAQEMTWRKIKVAPVGGAINVEVDGRRVLTYRDEEMLPRGEVAIDTHHTSHIMIDNLEIMENWNCERSEVVKSPARWRR